MIEKNSGIYRKIRYCQHGFKYVPEESGLTNCGKPQTPLSESSHNAQALWLGLELRIVSHGTD